MQSVAEVRTLPRGYHSVTPYLIVDGAPKLVEFMKNTSAGKEER